MTIEIWHPIGGKWVHLVQTIKDGIRQYFTDGVLVMTKEINKDGIIKEP
jgi:hypothetical protein